MRNAANFPELEVLRKNEKMVLFYLSTPDCGVCRSILPKVEALMDQEFPEIPTVYVDLEKIPEAGGQYSVFTIPGILVFAEGREIVREARFFGIDELGAKIERVYSIIFREET